MPPFYQKHTLPNTSKAAVLVFTAAQKFQTLLDLASRAAETEVYFHSISAVLGRESAGTEAETLTPQH